MSKIRKLKNIKNIVITAGGTGGHIYPGLAIAKELIQRGYLISWIGSEVGLEKKLVPEAGIGIESDFLKIAGVRNKSLLGWIQLPFKLMRAVLQARKILKNKKADLVISFGGFASGPAGLAAKSLGVPLFIHEQNAILGMTNFYLAKMAARIFSAFPINHFKSEVIGNPIRADILEIVRSKFVDGMDFVSPLAGETDPKRVCVEGQRGGKREGPLKILITGGSQGSLIFNTLIPEALSKIKNPMNIHHQAGPKTLEIAQENYKNFMKNNSGHEIQVVPYFSEIVQEYQWADLIICRSGALTVSEVAAVGLPAIFIPHPNVVDDHQRMNAEWLSEQGAGICLIQKDLTAEKLAQVIQDLSNDRKLLDSMGQKAKALAKKEAVSLLCNAVDAM